MRILCLRAIARVADSRPSASMHLSAEAVLLSGTARQEVSTMCRRLAHRLIKAHTDPSCSELNRCEIVGVVAVKAGCNRPEMLEFREEPLDQISHLVDLRAGHSGDIRPVIPI